MQSPEKSACSSSSSKAMWSSVWPGVKSTLGRTHKQTGFNRSWTTFDVCYICCWRELNWLERGALCLHNISIFEVIKTFVSSRLRDFMCTRQFANSDFWTCRRWKRTILNGKDWNSTGGLSTSCSHQWCPCRCPPPRPRGPDASGWWGSPGCWCWTPSAPVWGCWCILAQQPLQCRSALAWNIFALSTQRRTKLYKIYTNIDTISTLARLRLQ